MGSRRVLEDFRAFKDDGSVATDATVTAYLAGTTTPTSLYADKDLTSDLGSAEPFSALGVPPDLWASDQISYKLVVAGTGMTTKTWDYYAVAESATASSSSSDTEFRNLLRNAGFAAWSGGTSFSNISGSGTGVEVADGWFFVQATAASNSITQQTGTATGARYGLRMGRPAASTSTNALRLWQTLSVDDAYRLRGQEVTLSFTATAGANYSPTSSGLGVKLCTGTTESESGDLINAGGFAGNVNDINQTQVISTTKTRYQFTATLASNIKVVGIQFSMTGVGTAGANDWVQIEDVQLEIASSASDFAHAPEPLDFIRENMTAGGRLFVASTFTDPGADRLLGWDDSAGAVIGFTMPTGLSFSGTGIVLANDLAALEAFSGTGATGLAYRSASETWGSVTISANLGFTAGTLGSALGTAATQNTGTSGANVPLLDGANTHSGVNTFTANPIVDRSGATAVGSLRIIGGGTGFVHASLTVQTDTDGRGAGYKVWDNGNDVEWFWGVPYNVSGGGQLRLMRKASVSAFSADNDTADPAAATTILTATATGIAARVDVSTETSGTLSSVSANRTVKASGGITINDGVFTADDQILIYAGSSSRTITQDTGMTLRLDGTATTGNRTIAAYGKMHVYFNSNSEAICSGQGVS